MGDCKMGLIKDSIKYIPFIKELDENALNTLLKVARLRQYKNNNQIFSSGTPINEIYFVLKGKVKIFNRDSFGREQLVWIMQEGDIFPLTGFFREGTFPANAEAMENSVIVSIAIHDFESIILNDPEVIIKLFRIMGDRIIELQTRLEEQILHDKYIQIVKLLLRLCEKQGKIYPNGLCHLLPQFTNTDLAKMVGTSRWEISRSFSKLKKERLLYKNIEGDLIFEFEKLKRKFG